MLTDRLSLEAARKSLESAITSEAAARTALAENERAMRDSDEEVASAARGRLAGGVTAPGSRSHHGMAVRHRRDMEERLRKLEDEAERGGDDQADQRPQFGVVLGHVTDIAGADVIIRDGSIGGERVWWIEAPRHGEFFPRLDLAGLKTLGRTIEACVMAAEGGGSTAGSEQLAERDRCLRVVIANRDHQYPNGAPPVWSDVIREIESGRVYPAPAGERGEDGASRGSEWARPLPPAEAIICPQPPRLQEMTVAELLETGEATDTQSARKLIQSGDSAVRHRAAAAVYLLRCRKAGIDWPARVLAAAKTIEDAPRCYSSKNGVSFCWQAVGHQEEMCSDGNRMQWKRNESTIPPLDAQPVVSHACAQVTERRLRVEWDPRYRRWWLRETGGTGVSIDFCPACGKGLAPPPEVLDAVEAKVTDVSHFDAKGVITVDFDGARFNVRPDQGVPAFAVPKIGDVVYLRGGVGADGFVWLVGWLPPREATRFVKAVFGGDALMSNVGRS